MRSVLQVNDFNAVEADVHGGFGIGLFPEHSACCGGDRSEVIRLFPDWALDPDGLWLVWLESRHLSPRVRAFVDSMIQEEEPVPSGV